MCPLAYNKAGKLDRKFYRVIFSYSCQSSTRLVVAILGLCYSKSGHCSKEGHSKKRK
jgi:hypothetical protein